MQISLNELYLDYYCGKILKNDLECALYMFFMNNQDKTCLCHWTCDEYEDFISWFFPRIQKCIDSYEDIGSSFDAFINKFIYIASREYHTRSVINSVIEYSAWSSQVPEMYVHEEPPAYNCQDKNEKTENTIAKLIIDRRDGRKNTRRILALVLKCYYYVSDEYADKIAPLIGITPKELIEYINKIKKIRQNKDCNLYLLKERIFCQFYRCMVFEKRLSIINENTIIHSRLKTRLEKARQRLEKMRHRMTSIRTEATNKQIAEVIGVKKGTIDSSLYKLKMQWKEMSEKADLN